MRYKHCQLTHTRTLYIVSNCRSRNNHKYFNLSKRIPKIWPTTMYKHLHPDLSNKHKTRAWPVYWSIPYLTSVHSKTLYFINGHNKLLCLFQCIKYSSVINDTTFVDNTLLKVKIVTLFYKSSLFSSVTLLTLIDNVNNENNKLYKWYIYIYVQCTFIVHCIHADMYKISTFHY